MKQLVKLTFWPLYILVVLLAAMVRTHLDGDAMEYLSMTYAFTQHASPVLSPGDFSEMSRMLLGKMDPVAHGLIAQVNEYLARHPSGIPHFGFARTESGEVYAIHFWLYSLLAIPFYSLLSLAGANLAWSYSLLNLTIFGLTIGYLKKSLPNVVREAALVVLALGTIYYLRWTGPEVMAGCCVLAASICVLRRDSAAAILLCGIGATQNPSIALMIPLVVCHRFLAVKIPGLAPLPPVTRRPAIELGLAAIGLFAAASSYLFYYSLFGLPSLIAPYFTDPALISARRAISFVADLDQGMLIGIPGLFVGLFLVVLYTPRDKIKAVILNGIFFLFASSIIAAPTLAAVNWNSGTSVLLRYAYWAAMPLLAFLVSTFPSLTARTRTISVSAILIVQFLALLGNGWILRDTSYLQHTPLARWVLAKFPRFYNPDPEIFIERAKHNEASISLKTTQLFYDGAVPVKYLRHWSNSTDSSGLCAASHELWSDSIVEAGRGWEYLNGPLTCRPVDSTTAPLHFNFAGPDSSRHVLLSGWAASEGAGTWSLGKRSVIRVKVPPGREITELYFTGHYFHHVTVSEVTVNGHPIGKHALNSAMIGIPSAVPRRAELVIELFHPDAMSPNDAGLSADTRELAFYLKAMQMRTRDPGR